jgi:hypothetical protein
MGGCKVSSTFIPNTGRQLMWQYTRSDVLIIIIFIEYYLHAYSTIWDQYGSGPLEDSLLFHRSENQRRLRNLIQLFSTNSNTFRMSADTVPFSWNRHWLHLSLFFPLALSPNSGPGVPPYNFPFHFSLLDLRQSVGLLGRMISLSQGLYLYTNTEKRTYTNTKHPCLQWDSNPRTRLPSERRQYMP